MNATYQVSTSPDGNTGLLNAKTICFVDILRLQHRVKLAVPKDQKDSNYSQIVFQTPIDMCRIAKGIQSSIVTRTFMENIAGSEANIKCSYPKGSEFVIKNLTVTDQFLPPIPIEMKFMYENNVHAVIGGKKGWTYLYRLRVFGRGKK